MKQPYKPFFGPVATFFNRLAVLYLIGCAIEDCLIFTINVEMAAKRARERRRRAQRRASQLARGLTEDQIQEEDWDAYYMEETTDLVPLTPEELADLQVLAEHEVRPGFLVAVGLFLSFVFLVICLVILQYS